MLLEWGWNKYYGIQEVPVNPDLPNGEKKDSLVYQNTDSTLMERYWFDKSRALDHSVEDRGVKGLNGGFRRQAQAFAWIGCNVGRPDG